MDMLLVGFPVTFLVDCCSHRRWPSVRVEPIAPRRHAPVPELVRTAGRGHRWHAGGHDARNGWEHHPDHDEGSTPLGYRRWADLILPRRPGEETIAIPVVTPAMRFRGGDLRWDPRRR